MRPPRPSVCNVQRRGGRVALKSNRLTPKSNQLNSNQSRLLRNQPRLLRNQCSCTQTHPRAPRTQPSPPRAQLRRAWNQPSSSVLPVFHFQRLQYVTSSLFYFRILHASVFSLPHINPFCRAIHTRCPEFNPGNPEINPARLASNVIGRAINAMARQVATNGGASWWESALRMCENLLPQ